MGSGGGSELLALPARIDEGHEHVLEALALGEQCLQATLEEARRDGRKDGEDTELAGVEQQVALRFGNVAHVALMEALAEAHGHEEREHGVLERLHDGGRGSGSAKPVDVVAAP
jgi:hypothetical protein